MELFFVFECVNCDEEIKYPIFNFDGKPEIHLMCFENTSVTCPSCDTENCICEIPILNADDM